MGMEQMQKDIDACPSWSKFDSSNINVLGLYCQQNGQNYKCTTSSDSNGISVGGCPQNFKIVASSRMLRGQESSKADADMDDAMQQLDKTIEQMQKNLAACPSWAKFDSNSMNVSGLYCQQNGQNYKCTKSQDRNGISVGSCLQNFKVVASPSDNGIADHVYNNDEDSHNKMGF